MDLEKLVAECPHSGFYWT